MRSATAVIKLSWHSTAGGRGHVRSVAGLLDYVHHHDRHPDLEKTDSVEGLTRYVAWRDQATPNARLFDADGTGDDVDRARLAGYVERSVEGLDQTPAWRVRQNRKAFYHLIISPEDAHGLDLRRATRSVMTQLGRDAGTGGLSPWIAAEHRNTLHPHVHVVLAARRQLENGRYRRLDVPLQRLDRLHESLAADLLAQRDDRAQQRSSALRAVEAASKSPLRSRDTASVVRSSATPQDRRQKVDTLACAGGADRNPGLRPDVTAYPAARVASIAGKLARHYMREAEREAMRRIEASRRNDWECGE